MISESYEDPTCQELAVYSAQCSLVSSQSSSAQWSIHSLRLV
jgi:hypothetical protein